jgi:aminocarboxymuconate-semialdehyde decarboxylase
MLDAARAQPKAPRLPVKVGGKRVRTVDVHAHCYFHEAIDLMGDDAAKVLPPVKGVPEHFIVIEQRLKQMDAMEIDMEVLSINPFWYGKDRDTAAAIVKLQNEKLAELCASRPDRFGAFASLSLQFPDLAVQQLETAVKKAGAAWRGHRRQRAGYRFFRREVSSGVGQGRAARRGPLHPSAEHTATGTAFQG